MALSIAAIKAEIKTQREAVFGTPDDPTEADKGYTADATAIYNILTSQASTVLNDGTDSNGDTLVDLTGSIV